MSLNDSNTPETGQPAAATSRRSGLLGNVPLLVGLVLVIAVGLFAVFTLGGDDDAGASADRVTDRVTLTTAPAMEDLVKAAVKDVNADEPCIDIQALDSLVNQLKTLRDPAKPVKVIIVGLSQESDTGELDEITAATGGQKYVVNDPNQILGALAQALSNR